MGPKYVRITPDLLQLLATHRVRSAPTGERWRGGDVLQLHPRALLEPYCLLAKGSVIPGAMLSFSYSNSECDAGMRIGRYTSIAEGVSVMGPPHPTDWVSTSPFSYFSNPRRPFVEFFEDRGLAEPELLEFDHGQRQVIVGHDVWIGNDAMLSRGIEIGQGAVVGARSVVTRNVPPYAVVAGVPARILRYRFDEPLIKRMIESKWWSFTPDQLRPLDVRNPERFLDQLHAGIAKGMKPPHIPVLTCEEIVAAGELVRP